MSEDKKYVWVIEIGFNYEGNTILGIFDSEEKASDFAVEVTEEEGGEWTIVYENLYWALVLRNEAGVNVHRTKMELK